MRHLTYRFLLVTLAMALVVGLGCGDDDGSSEESNASDAGAEADAGDDDAQTGANLECDGDEWTNFSEESCEGCPAAELECAVFDFYESEESDSRWIADDEELRIHLEPGMTEIVEAEFAVSVHPDTSSVTHGEDHDRDGTADGDVIVFDFGGLLDDDEKLSLNELTITDACGESYTAEIDTYVRPDEDRDLSGEECGEDDGGEENNSNGDGGGSGGGGTG